MAARFEPIPGLGNALAAKLGPGIVGEIQKQVHERAVEYAPVDTGNLVLHIDVRPIVVVGAETRGQVVSYADKKDRLGWRGGSEGKSYTYPQGATKPGDYAPFVEFGTRFHAPVAYMLRAALEVLRRYGGA
jgi:hypothetical protein